LRGWIIREELGTWGVGRGFDGNICGAVTVIGRGDREYGFENSLDFGREERKG
jgi:hypothetical protein